MEESLGAHSESLGGVQHTNRAHNTSNFRCFVLGVPAVRIL